MSVVAASPDFVAIVTNVGVFLAASGTVVAAIWGTVKKIKSALPTETAAASGHKFVGGAVLDSTSILMWSESNRDVADVIRDLQKEIMELRFAVTQLKDTMK